ncbi:MAG TPA: nuclear transport factor 2 family protein [Candidatus Limnocylindrales bacterium]|nr:nuclear transport factor 2 family protein [Candidatus Limnocylindrales bacterium]
MATRQDEVSAADLASIERAATDYIEAWLTGDADRMADCLHPELTKRAVDDDAMHGRAPIGFMTHADMVEATRAGRGSNLPRDYVVTVESAFRNIATARVDSARYVDFLHIARFEDRWRIVSVLWEPRERG